MSKASAEQPGAGGQPASAAFLIDNGQSLERDASIQKLASECGSQVSIFKNRNAGGAGGFTRGMLEASGKGKRRSHPCAADG